MNKGLGLDITIDKTVLTNEDIVTIMKLLIDLSDGAFEVDDIDHLTVLNCL